MSEPLAYLPERIHLELTEADVALHALELLALTPDPYAPAAEELYHRLLGRLWPELDDLRNDEEGT